MASVFFNLLIQGPAPGTATTGSEQWINLLAIPSGSKIWIGNGRYSSPDKSITFELRTNTVGKSISGITNTALIDTVSVSVRSGTLLRDMYKNGRMHVATVLSTGVENLWLRLVSKTASQGSYLYSLNYTLE